MAIRTTPDVLVIGAGIVGASVAWRLGQQGLSVTMVDAGEFSGESSRAGAGMLAPGGEFGENSRWSYFAVESRRLYPAFVEELRSDSGRGVDLRLCGALELARGEQEWQALNDRASRQAAIPVRSEKLSHGLALALAPALAPESFDQAMLYPDDGMIDPTGVTAALRIVLPRLGVEIAEHTAVTAIDAATGVVLTDAGCIHPGATVVAAGAWSSAMLPREAPRAVPVKGHLIGYAVEPGMLGPVVRHGHTYMLQRSNGFLIAGATTEHAGFDRTVDPAAAQALHSAAGEYVPGLRNRVPDRSWIGFRPGAIDASGAISNTPVVERLRLADGSPTNVWLSYGHYRNGILLAPLTAKLLTAEIACGVNAEPVSANSETD